MYSDKEKESKDVKDMRERKGWRAGVEGSLESVGPVN